MEFSSNLFFLIQTNCFGVFLCMKYEIEQMLTQKPDEECPFTIVNTSSTAGLKGMPEFPAYSASKHAIIG
jgi:NAD(P)-dependent dehydrogenase (short-subunit alcohol dehydrogenase family)